MAAAVSVKMAVLSAVLAVVFVAPPQKRALRTDVTGVLNNALEKELETVADPLPLGNITLTTDDDMFQLNIVMEATTLAGIKDLVAHSSTYDISTHDVNLRIMAENLTIATDHYTISGTVVDHIQLQGEGPATIVMDNLDLIITGKVNLLPTLQFTEIYLDLELRRWTVAFRGLMPGTDVGTVFNEALTMNGPKLMDMLEKQINESGKLLDIVNGILSGMGGGTSELTSLIVSSLQKINLQQFDFPL